MNQYSNATRRLLQAAPLFSFVVFGFVQCGKQNIPVEELSRARQEIELAEKQEPSEEAAELLSKSTDTLLEAHSLLQEGRNDEAAARGIQARVFALQSRLDSAPAYGVSLQEKSSNALQMADEAFAEALARDDYESARALHEEGTDALSQAEGTQVTPEHRENPLTKESAALVQLEFYEQAFEKFEAAIEASERARSIALSQKSDMVESVAAVEAMLEKARDYGIEKYDEEGYKNTTALLIAARQDIEADKLKAANEKIVEAEGQATTLLATAQKGKAEELAAEAEKVVASAQSDFGRASAKLSAADRAKYGEYLKASGEALDSAKLRYDEEMYEESIQESRESIRLAMLVREGAALNARELARLEAERKEVEEKIEGKDSADGEGPEVKTYTVKKTRPAESLWRISKKKEIYGKGSKWTKIYDANRDKIKDPDLIYPGQELVIPEE